MAYQAHFKGEGLMAKSPGIFLYCLGLEGGTNRPHWNIGIKLPTNVSQQL